MWVGHSTKTGSWQKDIIGSRSQKSRDDAKATLEAEGHAVETVQLDVADRTSVESFAKQAAKAGIIDVVVHTSGVSPATHTGVAEQVLGVNLLGTAYIIDAFLEVIGKGASFVHLSSIAAHMAPPMSRELQRHLAVDPSSGLLKSEHWTKLNVKEVHIAYSLAKQATNLRVQGYVKKVGDKGARINSVSPAIVLTKMGHAEVQQDPELKALNKMSALGRFATSDDVASAVMFLAGHESSYVTGTDILLDGGSLSILKWGFE